MKHLPIVLFLFAVIGCLIASGFLIFWAYLVSVGKPALSTLVLAGSIGSLAVAALFAWAKSLN